jgi:hypothetical protein
LAIARRRSFPTVRAAILRDDNAAVREDMAASAEDKATLREDKMAVRADNITLSEDKVALRDDKTAGSEVTMTGSVAGGGIQRKDARTPRRKGFSAAGSTLRLGACASLR